MTVNELIVDRRTFSSLREECHTIFETGKRLPDFVFSHPFDRYFAFEYAYVYRPEFGLLVSRLSGLLGDESVRYLMIDPDPGEDYFSEMSFFGGISITPSLDGAERCLTGMSREGNVRRILVGANIGAFWGASLKWGIHCDRISWELAVIGVPKDIDVPALSGIPCMNEGAIGRYMEGQYHWSGHTAKIFTPRFLNNYAI